MAMSSSLSVSTPTLRCTWALAIDTPGADVLYVFFGCRVTGTVSNFGGSDSLSGDELLDFEAETKY